MHVNEGHRGVTSIGENEDRGKRGERIARHLLQQALDSNVPPVTPDRGLDALIEFPSPGPGKRRLHLGVQIKTGFSFVEEQEKQWRIKIERRELARWKASVIPVMFVWVHPDLENAAYWHLITNQTCRDHFFISKRRRITPSTRYDLAMKLEKWEEPEEKQPCELLMPPLRSGVRPVAKELYRHLLRQLPPVNPLLGPVRISWHGWRHISGQGRPARSVVQSLQLLPALQTCLENPLPGPLLRRVSCRRVGTWIFDTRLIIFRSVLEMRFRADAWVECVVRETIRYRADWMSAANAAVSRTAAFESIYEREKKWPQAY
jgi:hypothetical protein